MDTFFSWIHVYPDRVTPVYGAAMKIYINICGKMCKIIYNMYMYAYSGCLSFVTLTFENTAYFEKI